MSVHVTVTDSVHETMAQLNPSPAPVAGAAAMTEPAAVGPGHIYRKADLVWYRDRDGRWVAAKVGLCEIQHR